MLKLERPWTRQPQGAVPLRAGALARGLVAFGSGADGGGWEAINGPTKTISPVGRQDTFVAASAQYLKKSLVLSLPLTLFALVRPAAVNVNQALVSVGAGTNDRHLLYLGNSGQASMFSGSGATTAEAVSPVSSLVAGTYYSIVGRVLAADFRHIFINGAERQSATSSVSPAASSVCTVGAYWTSGAPVAGFYLGGDVAIWGVWNRALRDSEVRNLYDNPWQLFAPRRIWVPQAGITASGFKPAWVRRPSLNIGLGVN